MWDYAYNGFAIATSFAICALVTTYTLYYYTRKDRHSFTCAIYVFLWLTYFVNFCSLALITVDISMGKFVSSASSTSSTSTPATTSPAGREVTIPMYMTVMWKVIYWSIQVLSWIAIPICQSYVLRGEFTVVQKLWASIVENVRQT